MAAHNKTIKTIDGFIKKIDKNGKKVLNFSHSKCDKKVVFYKDIFDGFLAGVIDLRRGCWICVKNISFQTTVVYNHN